MLSKNDQLYRLCLEYQLVYDLFDQLRNETEKSLESIQRSLQQSRPMIISIDHMDSYLQRINHANEITLSLDSMLAQTFEIYMTLVRNCSQSSKTVSDSGDLQRFFTEKYELSMKEWQVMVDKIDRFHKDRRGFQ